MLGLFQLEYDFPSVEPPDYLRQLSPALYEQEKARVAGRFDVAVRLAEEAFTNELARLGALRAPFLILGAFSLLAIFPALGLPDYAPGAEHPPPDEAAKPNPRSRKKAPAK